jgi:hypothetical protein
MIIIKAYRNANGIKWQETSYVINALAQIKFMLRGIEALMP